MSASQRYGTLVWDALWELTDNRVGCRDKWVSVREVAEKADVSINTAKKYLMMLWERGEVSVSTLAGRKGWRAKIQ